MPGGAQATRKGSDLAKAVVELGMGLGLDAIVEFRCGRRIWGAERRIDVIFTHAPTGRRLGIECKYQGTPGTAEEKIPTTIQDIAAWPIEGLIVFAGAGFSAHMRSYLIASGKAVELADLEPWLRLYFGLPL